MNLLKPFSTESFIVGLGIAAVGSLFAPAIKKGAKTMAVKGTQGAMMAGEAANNMMESGKETLNNTFPGLSKNKNDSEAAQKLNKELISELRSDREQYANVLQELVTTMKDIQSEVKAFKSTNNNPILE
ncbi:MAG: hypothetical protein SA378_03315 [Sedimentibacter sp.]|uniref:hypothetical protein n=1 Tax=Sedimentibacter sp. TaxID=1960295 RepID=UPI0029811039|nr:hypothetical protein [Sedimentibacter sp.]MDW5299155.1 hypothetical protein [Sedimentibacter sp.]